MTASQFLTVSLLKVHIRDILRQRSVKCGHSKPMLNFLLSERKKRTNLVKLWLVTKFHTFLPIFHVPWFFHDHSHFPFPISMGTLHRHATQTHVVPQSESSTRTPWVGVRSGQGRKGHDATPELWLLSRPISGGGKFYGESKWDFSSSIFIRALHPCMPTSYVPSTPTQGVLKITNRSLFTNQVGLSRSNFVDWTFF